MGCLLCRTRGNEFFVCMVAYRQTFHECADDGVHETTRNGGDTAFMQSIALHDFIISAIAISLLEPYCMLYAYISSWSTVESFNRIPHFDGKITKIYIHGRHCPMIVLKVIISIAAALHAGDKIFLHHPLPSTIQPPLISSLHGSSIIVSS